MKNLPINDLLNQHTNLRRRLKQLLFFVLLVLVLDRLIAGILLQGLERYYGINDPASVLLIGHSHIVLGVDKVGLEKLVNKKVAKYAKAGSTLRDRAVMIEHYLNRNPGKVELVIFGVDAHLFTPKGLSSNSYRLFYPYMDDEIVARFLNRAEPSRADFLLRRIMFTTRYDEVTVGVAMRGMLGNWRNYKRGKVNIDKLKKEIADGDIRPIHFDNRQFAIFEKTIRLLRERGIKVVLAFIPTLDIYNGIEPDAFKRAISIFETIADESDDVYFVDFNPEFSAKYEFFRDPIHLNAAGQKVITRRLADWLRPIMVDK